MSMRRIKIISRAKEPINRSVAVNLWVETWGGVTYQDLYIVIITVTKLQS